MAASRTRLAGFAARNDSHPPVTAHEAGVAPTGRVALCLSGGGFRAALFHLGALRRLNEAGVLGRVDTVASVSGGSILAAHLAATVKPWPKPGETFPDWEAKVAMPFRDFVSSNLRTPALLGYLRTWRRSGAAEALARLYAKRLTGMTMGELPDRPRFVFCATDMAYGAPWRFSRDWMGDGRVGYAPTPPETPVAQAVAASSCFPPVFNPLPFPADPEAFRGRPGSVPQDDPEWEDLVGRGLTLSDGGLYDNLGLDVVWPRHAGTGHTTILMSDGGASFDPSPDRGLFKRLSRYLEIQGKQGWDARIQRYNAAYHAGTIDGAYWLIGQASHEGYAPDVVDDVVSEVRTDLDAFRPAEIQVLENHGYAVAQSRLHHFAPSLLGNAPDPMPPHPDALDPAFVRRSLAKSHKRAFPLGRFGRGAYSKRFPAAAGPAIRGFAQARPPREESGPEGDADGAAPDARAPPIRRQGSRSGRRSP